jgi:hypothetical protein
VLLSQLAAQPLRRCGQREAGKLYISGVSHAKTLGEETHEDGQGDSEITNLFDKALCRAIVPWRDDPFLSPPDIEHTATCLHNVEYEKRELW